MGRLTTIKPCTLFDHLNQIREHKDPEYYKNLTDSERKGFNQYVILMGLSMDIECIDEVAYISKFLNIIPDNHFYRICCDLIPRGKKYCKWIKSSGSTVNSELLSKVCNHYKISTREAEEYCDILMKTDSGLASLTTLLSKYGVSDKEIKKLISI